MSFLHFPWGGHCPTCLIDEPPLVDGGEKAFSSNLKGVASKKFIGGSAPRPPFSLFHFNMNPANTFPKCIANQYAMVFSCRKFRNEIRRHRVMKRPNENSVIIGILSFYDPQIEPLIYVPAPLPRLFGASEQSVLNLQVLNVEEQTLMAANKLCDWLITRFTSHHSVKCSVR